MVKTMGSAVERVAKNLAVLSMVLMMLGVMTGCQSLNNLEQTTVAMQQNVDNNTDNVACLTEQLAMMQQKMDDQLLVLKKIQHGHLRALRDYDFRIKQAEGRMEKQQETIKQYARHGAGRESMLRGQVAAVNQQMSGLSDEQLQIATNLAAVTASQEGLADTVGSLQVATHTLRTEQASWKRQMQATLDQWVMDNQASILTLKTASNDTANQLNTLTESYDQLLARVEDNTLQIESRVVETEESPVAWTVAMGPVEGGGQDPSTTLVALNEMEATFQSRHEQLYNELAELKQQMTQWQERIQQLNQQMEALGRQP